LALAGRTKVSGRGGEKESGRDRGSPLIDYSLAATAINNVGKLWEGITPPFVPYTTPIR